MGRELEKAKDLLRAAKLRVGEVNPVYNESFEEGRVIRQSVRGGEQAPQGSEVNLIVSRGPAPKPVPDVVGLAAERATERLEDAGFVVSADSDHSRKVAAGRVISQSPRSGNELQPGSTVSIDGQVVPARRVDDRTFEVPVPASAVSAVGTYGVVVTAPLPAGGPSNERYFFVDFEPAGSR